MKWAVQFEKKYNNTHFVVGLIYLPEKFVFVFSDKVLLFFSNLCLSLSLFLSLSHMHISFKIY